MINYDPKHVWPIFRPKTPPQPLIPKIIHQIWLGDRAARMDQIKAWKDKNPSWTHIFWNKTNLQGWRFHNEDKLDLMSETAGKCDIMRYEILYHLGGIYIDSKMPAQQLDESMFQYDCTAVIEGPGGLLSSDFLACQPRCELMRLCVEGMNKVASPAWWYVGSAYLTHISQSHNYPIKVYPEEKPPVEIHCRRQGVMAYYGYKIKRPATQLIKCR